MKTRNSQIEIFNSEATAKKAFDKATNADLLYSEPYKAWYVDKNKTALKNWPKLYTLINSK